jgi:hypothetical protein
MISTDTSKDVSKTMAIWVSKNQFLIEYSIYLLIKEKINRGNELSKKKVK